MLLFINKSAIKPCIPPSLSTFRCKVPGSGWAEEHAAPLRSRDVLVQGALYQLRAAGPSAWRGEHRQSGE